MDQKRFEELLNDKNVFKIYTPIGGNIFKDSNEVCAIQFVFMHAGDFREHTLPPKKRIFLSVYPFEKLSKEIEAYPINNYILILANADNKDYALSYKLVIDQEQQLIKLKIEDWPTVGDRFVTYEEREGIEENITI